MQCCLHMSVIQCLGGVDMFVQQFFTPLITCQVLGTHFLVINERKTSCWNSLYLIYAIVHLGLGSFNSKFKWLHNLFLFVFFLLWPCNRFLVGDGAREWAKSKGIIPPGMTEKIGAVYISHVLLKLCIYVSTDFLQAATLPLSVSHKYLLIFMLI